MDDIFEIQQLKARYFRLLDSKDWVGFRAVFTDGLTGSVPRASVGRFGDVVQIAGADGFVAGTRRTVADCITIHHGHMPEIVLDAAAMARGIWAMEDRLVWPDGRRLHGFGHYHETYCKQQGSWKIATLTLVRLHVERMGPWPA